MPSSAIPARCSGMLPAPFLALGAVSFPQDLAGDQMFHGQSTFTPTASRLLSALGKEKAGKQCGSRCTFLPHLPLSFPISPWTPVPASGWQVQPGGNSSKFPECCGTGTAKAAGQVGSFRDPLSQITRIVSGFQTSFSCALPKPSLTTSTQSRGAPGPLGLGLCAALGLGFTGCFTG